uniref:Uncharacterized protein n=1 Tax=viral metagenome TaxID=1070528 RepID=A0A6M3KQP1_9ZZZZ
MAKILTNREFERLKEYGFEIEEVEEPKKKEKNALEDSLKILSGSVEGLKGIVKEVLFNNSTVLNRVITRDTELWDKIIQDNQSIIKTVAEAIKPDLNKEKKKWKFTVNYNSYGQIKDVEAIEI